MWEVGDLTPGSRVTPDSPVKPNIEFRGVHAVANR